MLGFGPPADRRARREWWRRQIERQQQSQMTVAEFCRQRGIHPVTFYSWKRRFRDDAAVAPTASSPTPQPQPKPLTREGSPAGAAFVPVSIVDASAGGLLEIEFGNACTVRLKGAVDPKLLRIAIRAAGRLGTTQGGD